MLHFFGCPLARRQPTQRHTGMRLLQAESGGIFFFPSRIAIAGVGRGLAAGA